MHFYHIKKRLRRLFGKIFSANLHVRDDTSCSCSLPNAYGAWSDKSLALSCLSLSMGIMFPLTHLTETAQ
jgi:hypothetical protein